MTSSNFEIEVKDKYVVLRLLSEKLDGVISPELKTHLVEINSQGHQNIIIDLAHTRYCDSSGLSAILVGNRLCKNTGGTFVICQLQPMVMKLISISQLNNILNITPTLQEAVDYVLMEIMEKGMKDSE
ncbi:MAG: STAS domain-containing protein [Salibacteraceae bacterium]